jgi:cell division protease FtsH
MKPSPKNARGYLWMLAVILLGIYALSSWDASHSAQVVPYSELEAALAGGQVERVVITDHQISAYLKGSAEGRRVLIANRVEPDLAQQLAQYHTPYSREYASGWLPAVISWFAPVLIFFGVWYWLVGRTGGKSGLGGLTAIGRSRAKISLETTTGVTFADVAGVDEAKRELEEVVEFLKEPQRYGRLGAHIPKGVLLVGPPGTGKTLLARALAGEARVTFLSTNGAEFVEMFVGVGAARVRDLFEQARAHAPAIIFIDELDALGRARGAYGIGGQDEKEQTLNQLLAEMDGFDPSAGVIILGATNRPEILDPALLRAGRFDRQILVDRPDLKGRADVLRVHARKVKLAAGADLEKIAAMTPGFAGAELANVINEAALLATRRGADAVSFEDLTAAIERIVAGLEKKSRILNLRERETVAYHELGHALVAMSLPGSDPVHKVSVIPRGISALGYTIQRPTEDRYLMRQEELENKLAVLLGGRAAEMLVFGAASTGAADDLVKGTSIARAIVTRYGMSESLGLVAYEEPQETFLAGVRTLPQARLYSEATAREIDCAVREVIERAFSVAMRVLTRGRRVLGKSAQALLAKETLGEEELAAIKLELEAAADEPPGKVVTTSAA